MQSSSKKPKKTRSWMTCKWPSQSLSLSAEIRLWSMEVKSMKSFQYLHNANLCWYFLKNALDCCMRAFVSFLGGAPTSICHFFHLSVCPSLSVAHHISGTIHHLIIIFGTHFHFLKILIFRAVRGEGVGGKRAKNNPIRGQFWRNKTFFCLSLHNLVVSRLCLQDIYH